MIAMLSLVHHCSQAEVFPIGRHASCPSCIVHAPPTLQCCCCLIARPNVVLYPCRHQVCCTDCWPHVDKAERAVFNAKQRFRRQLSTTQTTRLQFRPRCPVCRRKVKQTYIIR